MLSLFVLAVLATGGLSWMKMPFLSFGEDIELSGAAFDQKKLDQISKLTGVIFPAGTEGLRFAYSGSGLDDSLSAKIRIPPEKYEDFMTNTVFSSAEDDTPNGDGTWWKPNQLTGMKARRQDLPNTRLLQIAIGHEGDRVIAYLRWSEM